MRLRWWRMIWRGRGETMSPLAPEDIASAIRGVPGKWVAVKDGQLVAAAETPDALYMHLHQQKIRGATILRAPAEDEPEMVGMR
jgi:hypothetical protein